MEIYNMYLKFFVCWKGVIVCQMILYGNECLMKDD